MGSALTSKLDSWLRPIWPAVALSVGIILIALVIGASGSSLMRLVLLTGLVNLVLVVGLYIFVGNSGIFSFGHMGFMAIGAYASGILSIGVGAKSALLPDLPSFLAGTEMTIIPATLIAGALAAVVALVIGIPFMRLSGIEAGISTLAFLLITQVVIANWDSMTRGTSSLVGIPTDLSVGVAVAIAVVTVFVAYAYQSSSFGLRMRAIREDEIAARSNGISVVREKTIAFVLSAFVCGVGGSLMAHYLGALRPDDAFFLNPTFMVTVMLVVGGLRSLTGAVVGVVVISVLSELLRRLEDGFDLGSLSIATGPGFEEIVLGALLILILAIRPSGLARGRELAWPAHFRSR